MMIFKQIKQRGDNFSYIITDEITKETAVIDPSFNTEAITRIAKDNGLNVKYVIDTHQHWDHIAGNDGLRSAFGAKIVAHKLAKCFKDIDVEDGDVIKIGKVTIKIIHTPGHTPDGVCLLVDGKLLTGDTLFVGECGRTDLPGGSAEDMYNSLFQKLMKLDDDVEVFPGHDYGSKPHSTIGTERKNNYTLKNRTVAEFVEFMQEP
jgi:glyoxylase-like metal-dependent hydrolase (beta-lactamase superfamily II)